MMKEYESPKAELIEFENDCILTTSGGNQWGTNCGYMDGGNDDPSGDCDIVQVVDPSDSGVIPSP